jgi:hypothetical protein
MIRLRLWIVFSLAGSESHSTQVPRVLSPKYSFTTFQIRLNNVLRIHLWFSKLFIEISVFMKFVIFWDIAPCSPYMSRRFGVTYHLHLQGRKISEQETSESSCLTTCSRWFFARLIFDPEDRGATFLRNVDSYTDYKAIYPRRGQIP